MGRPGLSRRPTSAMRRRWSKRTDDRIGVDAAHPLDVAAGDRLLVGHHCQGFHRGRAQAALGPFGIAADAISHFGGGGQLPAALELLESNPTPLE